MSGSDWFPTNREAILRMSQNWLAKMKLKGRLAWGIDEEKTAELEEAIANAEAEFIRPVPTRNLSTNATLKSNFVKLKTLMRDIKKRHFFVPPLTDEDITSLGLKPKDTIPTSIGKPEGKVAVKINYTADGNLQILLSPQDANAENSKAKYGVRVYYEAFAAGDTMPKSGKDLRRSKFTRKKKIVIEFEPEDKGKTAFVCAQYENSKGESGQWGDMVSAIVP